MCLPSVSPRDPPPSGHFLPRVRKPLIQGLQVFNLTAESKSYLPLTLCSQHIQTFGLSPTSAPIFIRVITGLHDRVRLLWMGMKAAHEGYNLQNSVPRGLQSSQFRCGYAHFADEELSKCPKSNASQRVFSSLVP